MKKILISKLLLCLIILITGNLYSQDNFSIIDYYTKTAGYIYEEKIEKVQSNGIEYEVWLKNDNKYIPKKYTQTGSCFFITTDFDEYLVTAEHVAVFTSKNTKIVISTEKNVPKIFNLGDIISNKNKLDWIIHPSADIAVIKLDYEKVKNNFPFCDFDMLKLNLDAPIREADVTVFGFPLSLGIGEKISSISKTSKPSSGLLELPRFDNRKKINFYFLDDPSVSGFSGGPVIQLPLQSGVLQFGKALQEDTNKIVGIVHGSKNGKSGGFAAITPSYYIKKTIEMAPGLNGKYKFNYPDGKIWSERIYKNGIPYTVLSNFSPNGEIQDKGTLKEGNGTLLIYDETGKLLITKTYLNSSTQKIEYKKKTQPK